MNNLLPTCDLKLDGTGNCPGHDLSIRGQFPTLDQWCNENRLCNGCQEFFWQGHVSASKVYEIYQHDTHWRHIESWQKRLDRELENKSTRKVSYDRGYQEYIRSKLNACIENKQTRESVLQARENLSRELGPREFTLTYSPSWFETDDLAQNAMRLAIERLIKYYKHELIEFHAIGEYTDAGNSHVHAWYHLTGGHKITDRNFKRAWPHWNPKKKLGRGFEGGHHQNIARLSDFAGYIEKHLEEAWLIKDINADSEENHSSQASSPSSSCLSPRDD